VALERLAQGPAEMTFNPDDGFMQQFLAGT
jgi:hypothetical protein